jgi:nucleoside phosphorylase
MIRNKQKRLSVVILTAIPVEYEAVRSFMDGLEKEVTGSGTVYERGTFSAHGQYCDVAIVLVGARNVSAASQTEHAIAYFKPDVVFFVGVAGGLKDVAIGDVVVATKIYGYEEGNDKASFRLRPEVVTSSYSLLQIARAEAIKGGWLQYVEEVSSSLPPQTPHVHIHVSPIIAGEKLISSSSDFYRSLLSVYGDAVAVEMEGYGFLQAMHANQSVDALIIRGIADLVDNKVPDTEAHQHQQLAALHASAFACQLLADLVNRFQSKPEPSAQPITRREATIPHLSAPDPTHEAEVFYAYAEEDERCAQVLQKYLVLLKRRGLITACYSWKMTAGYDPSRLLDRLDSAHIILLLISPDFLSSDYFDIIAARTRKRRMGNEAVVIPILLRPTEDWQATPFGMLQTLPRGDRPVAGFTNLDMAFEDITKDLRGVIESLKVRRSQ